MVPPPGTLLEPAEVQIGALVDARDDSGIWYRARVIDKTGRGAQTSVTVRFQRFNQKHDRKFKKSHQAIRVRLSSAALRAEQDVTQWGGRNDGRRDDGFWEVERIIKVRTAGQPARVLRRMDGVGGRVQQLDQGCVQGPDRRVPGRAGRARQAARAPAKVPEGGVFAGTGIVTSHSK